MSNTELFTAHNLTHQNGEIVDETTRQPFDRVTYSRMKYGDTAATAQLAAELSDKLMEVAPWAIEESQPPQFLVAYKAVPPACYYLTRRVMDALNLARMWEDHEPARLAHVFKDQVASTNYAAATPEERQQELDSIGFSLEGHSLRDTSVFVLDDIRITGAAEQTMRSLIAPESPRYVGLGYIAMFNQAEAIQNASVENELNASVVRGVKDLLPMINGDNFDLNIRTLKLILNADPVDLEPFLNAIPTRLLDKIHRGAIDTGPDFVDRYSQGYKLVSQKYGAHHG